MKWLRRFALVVFSVVACLLVSWWFFSARVEEWLRATLEEQLAGALSTDVEIGPLHLALAPPRVAVDGVSVGTGGEWIRASALDVRLLPYTSAKQLRPVIELEGRDVWVDVTRFGGGETAAEEAEGEAAPAPPFRVRRLRIENAALRIPSGESPLDLRAASLAGHVEVSRERRFTLAAEADTLRLERRNAHVVLDRVEVEGGESEHGLVVRKLAARGDEVEIAADLEGKRPLRHRVRADVALGRLAGLDEQLDGVGGRLRLKGTLSGALDDPDFEAALEADALRLSDQLVGDLRARARRERDRVEVEHASLVGFGGEIGAQGSLVLGDAERFDAQARWSELDVGRVAAIAGADGVPRLRIGGEVEVSGSLSPFSVGGRGEGRLRWAGDAPPVTWTLEAHAADDSNRFHLVAEQDAGNRVEVRVTVGPDEKLGGTLEAQVVSSQSLLSFAGVEDLPQATGSLSLSTTLSGTIADPHIEGRIEGQQVQVRGAPLERVGGSFTADTSRVSTDGIELALAGGRVGVNGTFGIDPQVENAWAVDVEEVDLGELAAVATAVGDVNVPVSDGTLSASVRGRGPWRGVVLDGRARIKQLVVAGEPIEGLELTGEATLPRWSADLRLVHVEDETFSAHVEGEQLQRIMGRFASTPWSLGRLAAASSADVSGKVRVEGALDGPPAALDGAIDVVAAALAVGERRLGDATARVRVESGAWKARLTALDDAVTVAANLTGGGAFSLDAAWREAHFGALVSDDPDLRIESTGTLRASGRIDAPLEADAEAVVPALTLASGAFAVAATEPIRLRGAQGTLTIESLRLAGDKTTLEASGGVAASGAVHVDVKGEGRLQILEAVGEPIESARGRFSVALSVDRAPAGEPQLDGRLSLSDGALDVGLPFGLTQTAGELRFDGSRIEIEDLAGNIGGGSFSVGGRIDVSAGPDLTWQVREMSTGLIPSLEHELSGKGSVRGTWRELTVAGDVEVLRALYDRRIDITSFLPSFKRELPKPPQAEPEEDRTIVHLRLHVFAPDELFIDNNFARIEAQADLEISGDVSAPRIGGQVQVLSGEVYFRERTFDVTTAVIDFRPELGLVAFLNIAAVTEIPTSDGTYTVRLQVTGTTDDPRVTMTSDDPSLTPNDVASLIAFGKTVAQLQEEGGGVSMGDVLQLAPGGYPEKVEKGAAKLLRLDRVEVEPTFSRTTGAFEPQLLIGKNFTEDLSASLATTFGATSSQNLRLSYELTRRFSLLGTWETESQNRDQAVGGGLRYRREFRDTPGFSLLQLGDGRTDTSEAADSR